MKKHEIEQKLNKSFDDITPDILEAVKRDCKTEKGEIINMNDSKSCKRRNISVIAAVFALIILSAGILGIYKYNNSEIAKINLDVNPSIELCVGKNDKILSASPLNTDGKKILDGMDLKDTDIDVAVNAVLGSMLKNGYINDAANSILLSVDGKNNEQSDKLRKELSLQIKEYLNNNNIESSVLSQNLNCSEKEVDEIAVKFDISKGKAKYIHEIIKFNPLYKVEDLVKLNINELNIVAQKNANSFEGVSTDGKPSDKAYISKEDAEKAALEHINTDSSSVTSLETEFDIESIDGKPIIIYEIEFCANGIEYEIDVNAETGKVLNVEQDDRSDDNEDDEETDDDGVIPEGNYITEEKAKKIALNKAGCNSDKVKDLKCELDKEDSAVVYEVEFKTDSIEYEFKIDAVTGEILKHSKEKDS